MQHSMGRSRFQYNDLNQSIQAADLKGGCCSVITFRIMRHVASIHVFPTFARNLESCRISGVHVAVVNIIASQTHYVATRRCRNSMTKHRCCSAFSKRNKDVICRRIGNGLSLSCAPWTILNVIVNKLVYGSAIPIIRNIKVAPTSDCCVEQVA